MLLDCDDVVIDLVDDETADAPTLEVPVVGFSLSSEPPSPPPPPPQALKRSAANTRAMNFLLCLDTSLSMLLPEFLSCCLHFLNTGLDDRAGVAGFIDI